MRRGDIIFLNVKYTFVLLSSIDNSSISYIRVVVGSTKKLSTKVNTASSRAISLVFNVECSINHEWGGGELGINFSGRRRINDDHYSPHTNPTTDRAPPAQHTQTTWLPIR